MFNEIGKLRISHTTDRIFIVFKLFYKSFVRVYEFKSWGKPQALAERNVAYNRCDVKCQYFVSFTQDSFLATELSLGLETIINETRIQISHGSV
jgi:hypothetical protein